MPEEQTTPVETTNGAGGQEQPAETTATFEAWLEKQPAEVKVLYEQHVGGLKSALDKERKAARKKDDELTAAENKRKQAELSEVDRLKAQLAELEKAKTQAEAKANDTLIRHAVEMAAGRMKFHKPEVAYQLLDLVEVEIDEDGKVKGVEEALKKLAKENPYLVNSAESSPDTDASRRGSGGKGVTAQQQIETWQELGLTHAVAAAKRQHSA